MRQARVGVALLLALGVGTGTGAARAQQPAVATKSAPSAAEAEVIDLERRGMESFVKGSPGGFAEAVGGPMVMVAASGGFTLTPKAIARMMNECTTTSYTGTDFRATSAGADVVVLTYDARMDYECGGKRFTPTWHALSVWQLRDGRWHGVAHSQTPPGSNPGVEAGRVREASAALVRAESAKDLDGVLAQYAEDVVAQEPGLPAIVGKPALRRYYEKVFASPVLDRAGSTTDVVLAASGDLAWAHGVTRVTLRGEQGPLVEVGKYLAIWQKSGGEWKIAAFSATSDGARPLPAGAR